MDLEINNLIKLENERQNNTLNLIASENYFSPSVRSCLSSILSHKYAEGEPYARYYGGCQYVDQIETIAKQRSLELFNLDKSEWDCNVQCPNGSVANQAAFSSILELGDTIVSISLRSGGHLTMGHQIGDKKISSTAKYYNVFQFDVDENGLIDYKKVHDLVIEKRPKLVITGGSAFCRDWDYNKFREIADSVGAYLMCDMSHTSGLISANLLNSPFEAGCDIVTTTIHKLLRGPRSAVIYCKKNLATKLNFSVFPHHLGGPNMATIASIAVAMKECCSKEYKDYAKKVIINAKSLATSLQKNGLNIVTDGTDNHIVLVDLTKKGISGKKVELLCDLVGISVNKNTVPTDISPQNPKGIRLGSGALTTRNLDHNDFENIGNIISDVIELGLKMQMKCKTKLAKDFEIFINQQTEFVDEIAIIKNKISRIIERCSIIE